MSGKELTLYLNHNSKILLMTKMRIYLKKRLVKKNVKMAGEEDTAEAVQGVYLQERPLRN